MENILSVLVGTVNRFLWDYLLIYALLGIGLFFTLYLGAPQILKFGAGFKSVFGGLFAKRDKDDKSLSSVSGACGCHIRANRYGQCRRRGNRYHCRRAGCDFLDVGFRCFGDVHDFCRSSARAEIPGGQPR